MNRWTGVHVTSGRFIVARGVLTACVIAGTIGALVAQQPQIQNGRVEARANVSIDRAVQTLGGPDPVWVGWRVPMVSGDRDVCSSWSNNDVFARGAELEPNTNATPPSFAPSSGPLPLESGTGLLVLVRLADGGLERLRTVGDDCPIDAGGRSVYWLTSVTPAESLRYLDALARQTSAGNAADRRTATAVISAIGLHKDPGADAILDRFTATDADPAIRRAAASALANDRDAYGFDRLTALISAEPDPELRRSFVTALGRTRQPGTLKALLALAETDKDPRVRGEAVYAYGQRTGEAGAPTVLAVIDKDADENVKRRGVSALAALPSGTAAPLLINLAETNRSLAVRKAAVSALGQSTDARAAAFLEALVAK